MLFHSTSQSTERPKAKDISGPVQPVGKQRKETDFLSRKVLHISKRLRGHDMRVNKKMKNAIGKAIGCMDSGMTDAEIRVLAGLLKRGFLS